MVDVLMKEKSPTNRKKREDRESSSTLQKLPDEVARDLVQLFKLFSDETRLRILHFLMQRREMHVRGLCQLLGQSQPAVSHHLALLRVAGLIECRRDGKHNYYHLVSDRLQRLIEQLFSVSPEKTGQLRFETFSLSYSSDKN